MITFKKEISIDGMAVIAATLTVIIWLANLNSDVKRHEQTLTNHEAQIQKMTDTQTALQINLSVLTALQKQNNNKP